jgi:F-type H+-transporting ATPase subunit delta
LAVWASFVETSGGIVAGLSGRYATALFDLAREDKSIDAVAASLAAVTTGLAESADLRTLTTTPMIDRASATRTIEAVASAMELDPLTAKFLGVLAHNRRLSVLPAIIRDFTALSARARGEVTAEVTSAHPLDAEQQKALKAKLRSGLGADAALILNVDPAILGGLVVRVGSRMVDSSLRTKLNSLATAMKG